jgi:photosystem II stability/assembly factor-like uncharacterized protein
MARKLCLSDIADDQGSCMGEKKISFHVLLILLVLIAIPPSNQTSIFVKNISWEPVQGPTISGGTISQILIDPVDSSHLFALQQQQDLSYVLFESQDAAVNWNAIYTFQDSIYSLTIDPTNPSILYAGTSDSILRSVNSGRNWVKIADFGPVIASPVAYTIYSIETMKYTDDCPTGNINFVVSRDKGNTWKKYPLGCYYIHQISTTPLYPNWIYIRAESDVNPMLYRSNDGGITWMTIPLTGTWFTHGFFPVAIDPAQPEKLYTSSGSGIIISINGGLTWRSVLDIPVEGPFHFSFSNDVIYAGVDPITYGELPVIYRSEDGGETWERLPWKVPDRLNDLQAMNSIPGWVLAALNGFGVYRSMDCGQSWQAANDGMRSAAIVEKMAVSQSKPDTVYAISHWPRDALFKTSDGGQTWSEPLLETMLYTAVVHPNNPNIVWIVDKLGIQESVNGGESWRRVSTLPVYDLAVSPDTPERPCAVGYSAGGSFLLCRETTSQSQEYHWVQSLIPGVLNGEQLTMSPTQGNWMMLSGRAGDALDYSVFASQDSGRSWQEIFRGPKDYLPLNLTVSGGQPAKVLAVYFQYHPDNLLIYQSLDSGESWQDITNLLSEAGGEMWTGWTYKAPVIFDDAGVAYFGTRNVVLQQVGNGQTWKVIWDNDDLIQDMLILPGSQDFLLVSSRRSLWKSQLSIFRSIWLPMIFR